MQHLELSEEEMEILNQVVQNSLAALELEVQHTDHQEYKNLLKHRREKMRTLVDKLRPRIPVAA